MKRSDGHLTAAESGRETKHVLYMEARGHAVARSSARDLGFKKFCKQPNKYKRTNVRGGCGLKKFKRSEGLSTN
jgi:hypothetical protein